MLPFILLFGSHRQGKRRSAALLLLLGCGGLAHGQAAPFMVRATPAGGVGLQVGQTQLLTATAVYPAFLSAGFDGPVLATAVQPDGKTLVGGRFTHCGTSTRQYLARLNADGTLDDSFTMGTELDSAVYALAVQPDGRILVGGNFTTFGGTLCGGLARLLPTGTLDPAFNAGPTPVSFNGRVRAIAMQTTGEVLVGGEFASSSTTSSGATTAYANSGYLVQLSSTGSFDTTFATNSHAATTGFNSAVLALVVQGGSSSSPGNILVGGRFGAPHQGLARLDGTGKLDTAFPTNPTTGPTGGEIAAIALVGNSIAVGGSFTNYTSGSSPSGYSRLALLDNHGELVPGFVPHFDPATSKSVSSIAALSVNQLLVGGQFSAYDGAPCGNLVSLYVNTGGLDLTFDTRTTFNAPVYSLAQQPGLAGSNVVVGGAFTTYKGGPIRASRIARLRPTGRPDDLDVPVLGTITYRWNTGQKDAAIFTSTTGLYWATATVGTVTNTSNTVALTVAAPTLAPITVQVTPVGPLNVASQLTATAAYPALQVGTGFNNAANSRYIWSFQTQANGKLVVGGNFTTYKGLPRQYITRLHADGNVDPTFTQTGINDIVTLVSVQPDGKILVGGDFSSLNSSPGPDHLARLNTDGSLDPTFKGGFGNSPMGIVYQPDGKMLLAGNFIRYYTKGIPISNYTPVRYVVRLMPDGTLDPSFTHTSGVGPNGREGLDEYVEALALQPDGKVLVGGAFRYYGPTVRQRVARLHADGSLDASFNPNGSGFLLKNVGSANDSTYVKALALQPDGKVLVGGNFAGNLVRLNTDGSLDTSFNPDHTKVSTLVTSLVLQSDGKMLVGGDFLGSLVRLNANGSFDPTFAITGAGFDDKVEALAIQADGQVLVGGAFANYNNTSGNRKGLARLNADGTLNNADTPVPPGTATYAWHNGSTGPTLWAAVSDTCRATATFLGQTALSNAVAVTVSGAAPAPFSVGITPTGPLSLCKGGRQTLTALAAVPAGTSATYTWWLMPSMGSIPIQLSSTRDTVTARAGAPGQYYALATVASGPLAGTAMSAAVSVGEAPVPTLSSTPITGLPGTSIVLKGTNLEQVTQVRFGTPPSSSLAAFAISSPTPNAAELTVTVPTGATPGTISVLTACSSTPTGPAVAFSFPQPTITTAALAGVQGSTVVVEGTSFVTGTNATTATLNNGPAVVAVASSTQLILTVPQAPGSYSLVVATAGGSSNTVTLVVSAATTAPVVFGTTITLPAGSTYANDNLIIKAPAVVTILGSATGNTFLVNRLEVQDGATLNLPDNTVVAGPASTFLLAAGATLTVGHPNGLGSAAAPGAIQLTNRFFSPDASYGYSGSQPQATGSYLPSQVRNLTSTNSSRLTLTQPVRVAQELTMAGAGHFFLNNQALTLLSNATGTALVVNKTGAGRVLGTATVQRYINPVANSGTGFRYYGSPVKGATAAVLAAPAFDYDQSRYRPTARQDTLPPISYGFTTSSLVPNTPLEVGHGYRAAVPAATTVQFTGTLTTGDTTLTLLRTGNAAYNGWNLVSNPYPAPLNWSKLVRAGDTDKLDAAIYVYESTGTGTGYYRSYVNGVSNDGLVNQATNGDLLIAMGQAFFVRVRKGETMGKLTFRDLYRTITYAEQASFNRIAAVPRFELSASLKRPIKGAGTSGGGCTGCNHADRITLYIDPALLNDGSHPFNSQLFDINRDADASNLFSFSQQTLSIQGGAVTTDSTFAIRAVAQPLVGSTYTQAVPLVISATGPDDYELQIAIKDLAQLGAGRPYLHDKSPTGPLNRQWTDLTAAGTAVVVYPFTLSAIDILNGVSTRFEIVFSNSVLSTTASGSALGSAVVYPNPAQHHIHVWMPAVPGAAQVQATLLNTLGQVVRRQNALLPAAGTTLDLEAEGLARGLYILRLQAGGTTTTRLVVLEN